MDNTALFSRLNIIGAGPGGYEAALTASAIPGLTITIFEDQGIGGSAILTDCVPSKALVSASLRHRSSGKDSLREINQEIIELANRQSSDIQNRLIASGVKIVQGQACLDKDRNVIVNSSETYPAGITLIATGGTPRILNGDAPDGKRIFTWKQLYKLSESPSHLIIVGSGVTGAEFACAYLELGIPTTLVSSRDHVLPGSDSDAAQIVEKEFVKLGGRILPKSRAISVENTGEGAIVHLHGGEQVIGSHALISIGSVPNTKGIGLEEIGVKTNEAGYIIVDKVSRTTVPEVYAAGDVTGVFTLASVAAGQGRTAVNHAFGQEVIPLDVSLIPSAIFTSPEIATIGETTVNDENNKSTIFPLSTNPRAKIEKFTEGFVKIYSRNHLIVGAVICSPHASELIQSLTLAVSQRISVNEYARIYTVYPTLSGSLAEASRVISYKENGSL